MTDSRSPQGKLSPFLGAGPRGKNLPLLGMDRVASLGCCREDCQKRVLAQVEIARARPQGLYHRRSHAVFDTHGLQPPGYANEKAVTGALERHLNGIAGMIRRRT